MRKLMLLLLLVLNVACVFESEDNNGRKYKEYWYNDHLYVRIEGDKIQLQDLMLVTINNHLFDEDVLNTFSSWCTIKRTGLMTYKDENRFVMRVDQIELIKAGDENGNDGEYCEIYIENHRSLIQNNGVEYFEFQHRDLMNYILNS